MEPTLVALLSTAVAVAFIHTLVGVDHYLPFIALGAAEKWSFRRAMLWTSWCGLGHVASTLILVLAAGGLGWAVGSIDFIDALRGDFAAYLLIGFGILMAIYDLHKGGSRHCHLHVHQDGTMHLHAHRHEPGAAHAHDDSLHQLMHYRSVWVMFLIFALGPCESLVPLILVPTLNHELLLAAIVFVVFSAVTIFTMCSLVALGRMGLHLIHVPTVENYGRALAGVSISLSGVLILFGF